MREEAARLEAEERAEEESGRARDNVNYNPNHYYQSLMSAPKSRNAGLKRPMKMPRVHDWQLYDVARLAELASIETAFYRKWISSDEAAPRMRGLTEEQEAERQQLLAAGFPTWTSAEHKALLRATERYGRGSDGMARVVEEVGTKSRPEVEAYAAALWARPELLRDEGRAVKAVEAGEAKLQQAKELIGAWSKAQEGSEGPWEGKPTLRGKGYSEEADHTITSIVAKELPLDSVKVRRAVWADEDELDCFLLSRAGTDLTRRAEVVMRARTGETGKAKKRKLEDKKEDKKKSSQEEEKGGKKDMVDQDEEDQ
jgi:SWI/SNF-related matrix-associated actin-dependent regulator of chromatin subfamily A member 5